MCDKDQVWLEMPSRWQQEYLLQCPFLGNLIWTTSLDETVGTALLSISCLEWKGDQRFIFQGGDEFLRAILLKNGGFYLQILWKLTWILKKYYRLILG